MIAKAAQGLARRDPVPESETTALIRIAGNAAVAKIILDYPTTRFVDYMSLLKINGEWKIVTKIFYAEPKAKPTEVKKAQ